jgi:hypothetical protein
LARRGKNPGNASPRSDLSDAPFATGSQSFLSKILALLPAFLRRASAPASRSIGGFNEQGPDEIGFVLDHAALVALTYRRAIIEPSLIEVGAGGPQLQRLGTNPMASERQVAANRANAKRSTGPRTAAGRATSSRNAYRHGLSLPMAPDSEVLESLARTLVRETAGEDQLEAARALAAAQLELKRIREVKVAATPFGMDQMLDPQALTDLCALGRYERLALSRRKAARRRLDEVDDGLG